MGLAQQEYLSGLSFPTPGDLPDPGMEPASSEAPASAGRFFTTKPLILDHQTRKYYPPDACEEFIVAKSE